MADKPEDIPAFKFTEKRVDDSWKEEVRREREAAAKKAEQQSAPPKPKRDPAPAHDHGHDHGGHDHGGHDHGAHDHGHAHDDEAPAAEAKQQKDEPAKEGKKPGVSADQQSKIFLTFLAGLAQQALMQLGEVESPFTGQREFDLQGARYTIELLNVIQQRTQGNLTPDEETSLTELIGDLKMRYVQIAREVQQQMAAQMAQQGGPGGKGPMRPGPGGSIPGMR